MSLVEVGLADTQHCLCCLPHISIWPSAGIWQNVHNIASLSLSKGEQFYTPLHWLNFHVLFDLEPPLELWHTLVNGGEDGAETLVDVIQQTLNFPVCWVFLVSALSLSMSDRNQGSVSASELISRWQVALSSELVPFLAQVPARFSVQAQSRCPSQGAFSPSSELSAYTGQRTCLFRQ